MPSKVKAYLDLTRPVNVLITVLSIPAASVLAGAGIRQWFNVLLAALTGGIVAAGANAINDYFDVEIDRINKPQRPIPRGDATKREARILWGILSISAFLLNFLISLYALGIVAISIVLLYLYSAYFKKMMVVGNLVVGLMTGMAFIYGAVIIGNVGRAIVPAVFAFLINVAREIVKDMEDVEGDRKEHAMTLPVRYGYTPALWFATVDILALITTTVIVYQFKIYTVAYFYLVLCVDIVLATVVVLMWKDQSSAKMNRLSNALKVCMVIGLAAIFLGSS